MIWGYPNYLEKPRIVWRPLRSLRSIDSSPTEVEFYRLPTSSFIVVKSSTQLRQLKGRLHIWIILWRAPPWLRYGLGIADKWCLSCLHWDTQMIHPKWSFSETTMSWGLPILGNILCAQMFRHVNFFVYVALLSKSVLVRTLYKRILSQQPNPCEHFFRVCGSDFCPRDSRRFPVSTWWISLGMSGMGRLEWLWVSSHQVIPWEQGNKRTKNKLMTEMCILRVFALTLKTVCWSIHKKRPPGSWDEIKQSLCDR